MPLSTLTLILFGLGLLITSVGFRRLVLFLSSGYAFAIVAMTGAVILLAPHALTPLPLLHNALLLVWGLRLGVFVLRREAQPSFQKEKKAIDQRYGVVSTPAKIAIWLAVSLLYVLMVTPSLYASTTLPPAGSAPAAWQAGGLAVMAAGLGLEALADRQKSRFKQNNPHDFCDKGVYAWVRCPNYLAEILFWMGNWIMGIPFYTSALRWILSLAGLAVLILIMLGSTRRLERAQNERYGDRPGYQAYVRRVPVLIPFVPLYTAQNIKIRLG
jgi:steroid 5-alpha reductase family enzyme